MISLSPIHPSPGHSTSNQCLHSISSLHLHRHNHYAGHRHPSPRLGSTPLMSTFHDPLKTYLGIRMMCSGPPYLYIFITCLPCPIPTTTFEPHKLSPSCSSNISSMFHPVMGIPSLFNSTFTLYTAVLCSLLHMYQFSLVCEYSLTPYFWKAFSTLLCWQRNQIFLYQKWQKVKLLVSLSIVNRRVSSERNLFKLEGAQHD